MSDLEIDSIEVRRGTITALSCTSFEADRRDIVALVGPNGAGKTTVFDVISGYLNPVAGRVHWSGRNLLARTSAHRYGLGIARSFQEVRLAWSLSVKENLKLALSSEVHNRLYRSIVRPFWSRTEESRLASAAESALKGHPLESEADKPAHKLSFGQRKVLAMSCCVATGASLLLLDEPVGGVAGEYSVWIESEIRAASNKGSLVLLAEHNLEVASQLADKFLALDAGVQRTYGSWEQVLPAIRGSLV